MSAALHRGQPVRLAGAALEQAAGAVVLIHGRGATADNILELGEEFYRPDWAYLAPQAAGYSWYPARFLSPFEQNEPWLSSALAAIGDLVGQIGAAGIPAERTLLLGFSQGACLSLEFAARNARRWGGVIALSGGLIGPDGAPRDYPGSLAGAPVFLGCSDYDPHIPEPRVHEAARVMERLGGAVTVRIYPGLGHAVNEDEMEFVRQLLAV